MGMAFPVWCTAGTVHLVIMDAIRVVSKVITRYECDGINRHFSNTSRV